MNNNLPNAPDLEQVLPDAPNPSIPELYRLNPADVQDGLGSKKVLTTVPVRRPGPTEFIRIPPDPAWRMIAATFEDKESREHYLVLPNLAVGLGADVNPVELLVYITRSGSLGIWPLKLPGLDGRRNPWNESAREAAKLATEKWIRIRSNMAAGAYDVFEATGAIPDPEWPEDLSFAGILHLAFNGRVIDTADHVVLRRLRGEI